MAQEYQRQCLSCGKVWHSLVKREKELASNRQLNDNCSGSIKELYTCGMCGSGQRQRAQLKVQTSQSELHRLRQCPQCQSSSYNERVIEYLPR